MNSIHNTIQSSGGRLTKIRKAILDILSDDHCLLSKQKLVEKLKSQKIKPDRSTIYRELKFLTTHNIITKNNIGNLDYYEIPHSHDHHHHLICIGCHSISRIKIDNQLKEQEKKISKKNQFNIINHSLEFYGYCHKCQA
jgi:Fur family ferric uptake transcriptional regulator